MKTSALLILLLALSSAHAQTHTEPVFYEVRDDKQDLQPLKDIIGSKQVVLLGEADHFHGTFFSDKLRVLKYLHEELGFSLLAFESGIYDLSKAAEEIKNGKNVSYAIHNSIFPIWMMTEEFVPVIDYLSENRDSLTLLGFDCQFSGEHFYENFEADLKKLIESSQKAISEEELEYWLDNVDDLISQYSMEAPLLVFQGIHARIRKAAEKAPGSPQQEIMLQTLKGIEGMAGYYAQFPGGKAEKDFHAEDNNYRDALMAENLLFWMNKYPDKKMVCWGANAHFANKVQELSHPELKSFIPMGTLVRKEAGSRVISIFFTGLPDLAVSDSLSMEAALYREQKQGFINLKNLPAGSQQSWQALGYDEKAITGDWSKVCDLIWFCGKLDSARFLHELPSFDIPGDAAPEKDLAAPHHSFENKEQQKIIAVYRHTGREMIVRSRVCDADSKEGLEYANVFVIKQQSGTITNTQGDFKLHLSKAAANDSVRISMVGYASRIIPVGELMTRPVIYLRPSNQMEAVVISAIKPDAMDIMKKVIKAIPHNYNQEEFTVRRISSMYGAGNGKYMIHESLFDKYDDDGYRKVPLFPFRYQGYLSLLGRRNIITDSTFSRRDSIMVFDSDPGRMAVTNAPPDVVNYRNNNFLNAANLRKYKFQIVGSTSEYGEEQYIIAFSCKKPKYRRTTMSEFAKSYQGELWINKSDFALAKATTYSIRDGEKNIELLERFGITNYVYDSTEVVYEKTELLYKKLGRYYYNTFSKLFSNVPGLKGNCTEELISVEEGHKPKPVTRGYQTDHYDRSAFEKVGR